MLYFTDEYFVRFHICVHSSFFSLYLLYASSECVYLTEQFYLFAESKFMEFLCVCWSLLLLCCCAGGTRNNFWHLQKNATQNFIRYFRIRAGASRRHSEYNKIEKIKHKWIVIVLRLLFSMYSNHFIFFVLSIYETCVICILQICVFLEFSYKFSATARCSLLVFVNWLYGKNRLCNEILPFFCLFEWDLCLIGSLCCAWGANQQFSRIISTFSLWN